MDFVNKEKWMGLFYIFALYIWATGARLSLNVKILLKSFFISPTIHYFIVTGFSYAVLKARLISTYDNVKTVKENVYKFNRNEVQSDIDYLKEKEVKFWNENVLKNKKPALILPEI